MLTRLATAKAAGRFGHHLGVIHTSRCQGAEQGTEATAQMDAIATVRHTEVSHLAEAATAAAATRGPLGAEVAKAVTTTAPAVLMGQEGLAGAEYT